MHLTPSQLDHAATIVAAWLGSSTDELQLTPATGGVSTPVYRIALDAQTCYLRLSESPTASLGPEALAHEVLLSHGARVPAVIGYEPFDRVLDRSLMLTTTIPGASLDDEPPTDPIPIVRAAGADLARIHQVPVQGFGFVRRDDPLPTQLSAPFPTWDDFAAHLTSGDLSPWFDEEAIAQLERLSRIGPDDRQRAALAHGDFDISHIYALNGQYTGIIDFGEIRGAEPTFDLGHLALHVPDALPAILAGYGSVTPLPSDIDRQIAASAIRIGWFRLTQSRAGQNLPYATRLVTSMTTLARHLA